jgi:hypothetical protein
MSRRLRSVASEWDEPPGLAGLGVARNVVDRTHAYLGIRKPRSAERLLKRCRQGRVIKLTTEDDTDVDPAL